MRIAVERLCKGHGRLLFPHPIRTMEQIGLGKVVIGDGLPQDLDGPFLAPYLIKAHTFFPFSTMPSTISRISPCTISLSRSDLITCILPGYSRALFRSPSRTR